jgi:peptidoglycan/LPS O-acetylase OafA/YrhL
MADSLTGVVTSSLVPGESTPLHNTTKFAYIDALRGYAVLMVITSHTGGMFAELPYPLKKLTNFGWHGVQLFFLMSCVTLLMSWRSDERKNQVSIKNFWIRRLFRIVPMYYLAAAFYYFIEPPPRGFEISQLLATLTFVNVWHPTLVSTIADRWIPVPGGWSIGVEMTFYLIFPLIALLVHSLRIALIVCGCTLVIGCVANVIVGHALATIYPESAVENFIYYWFPNQFPVFSLGVILYFILNKLHKNLSLQPAPLFHRHGTPLILISGVAGIAVANMPFPENLPFALPLVIPRLYVVSLIFIIVATILSINPRSPFINPAICSLGKVIFSAYLLHFAVLHRLPVWFPEIFDVHATGWHAIGVSFALWLTVVPVTFLISQITYRLIESPMMSAGRAFMRPIKLTF